MLVGVDEDDFDAADLLELATADPGRFEQQHVRARYAQPGADQLPEPLGRAGVDDDAKVSVGQHGPAAAQSRFEVVGLERAPRARPGSVEQDGVTGADDDRAAIQPEVDGHDEDPTVGVDPGEPAHPGSR